MYSEKFERPHRYAYVPPGGSTVIFDMKIPNGMTAFIEQIANTIYRDSYYILRIDGKEEKVERAYGTLDNPYKLVPPIVAKNRIEMIAYNNSLYGHIFECVIDGQLIEG
jgi:hypothetical protein